MEPWQAGRYSHLAPVPRLLCCCLEQCLQEARAWTEPLSDAQIWMQPFGKESAGFHLRHLAGSVDRLLTYARREPLTEAQLAFLRNEAEPGASKAQLLEELATAYGVAAEFAETADGLDEPRYIGRRRLETPLGVLLGHIAEHTQRHTGQLIILTKIAAGVRRDEET